MKKKRKMWSREKALTAKQHITGRTEDRINGINATLTLLGVYLVFISWIFFNDGDTQAEILAVMTSVSYLVANLLALATVTIVKFNQRFIHRNVCICNLIAIFVSIMIYSQAGWINNNEVSLRYPFWGSWCLNIILQVIFVITYYVLATQKTYVIATKYIRKKSN